MLNQRIFDSVAIAVMSLGILMGAALTLVF
jgi:hypothetical protein